MWVVSQYFEGEVMKKRELLKTEHSAQLIWLTNQIGKVDWNTQKNFLNPSSAVRAWEKLNDDLVINDVDLEHYISVHVSEIGIKKLVTTLRVYKKRMSTERLQVEITDANRRRLDQLVKTSGKTKIQIINYLISNSDISEFQLN